MDDVSLVFNFIGVSVVDWPAAFHFFGEKLGLRAGLEPKHGDWAVLGGAWDAYYKNGIRSAVFELFDQGRPVPDRYWGVNQGFRPGFHVSNLKRTVETIRTRNGISIGEIKEQPWGKVAEFSTTEGIRFAFAEIPSTPDSDDLSVPYIGHVAVKCADLKRMADFYGSVLRFTPLHAFTDNLIFTQVDGHPWIILEPGGRASTFELRDTIWENNAVRAFPVFISLMTTDIQTVYRYLKSRGVIILRDILSHEDWGGTDFHIADPDGNGIQIVQYG